MTLGCSLQTVSQQLNKLNQIMQQEQHFNRKYVLQALRSRNSEDSLMSQPQMLHKTGSLRNLQLFDGQQVKHMKRQKERYEENSSDNSLSNERLTDQWNNVSRGDEIQDESEQDHGDCQNQNDRTKNINELFTSQIKKQFDQNQNYHTNQLLLFVDLDEQTTTKSLALPFQESLDSILQNQQGKSSMQDSYIRPSNSIQNSTKYKQMSIMSKNKKIRQKKTCKEGKDYLQNDEKSSGNTETGPSIEISSTKKETKLNINVSLKKRNNTQKNKPQNTSNDKCRRPVTVVKTSDLIKFHRTDSQIQSPDHISVLQKIDRNQLKKAKQQKQKAYYSTDKKNTNRKQKTKREVHTQSQTSSKPNNYANSYKSGKKFSSNYEATFEQLNNNESGATKCGNKSGKNWKIDKQKGVKKLNRVNITKLQQNFKKGKNNKTMTDEKDQQNKYLNNMYKNAKASQIINSSSISHKHKTNLKKTHHIKDQETCLKDHKGQNVEKMSSVAHVVEKLDFAKESPIMERMIENKNIFKSYHMMTNNYIESARKINTKYIKQLGKDLTNSSQSLNFRIRIISSIILFFTQFFVPTNKTIMGSIAKNQEREEQNVQKKCLMQADYVKDSTLNNISKDSLVSLFGKPKDLVSVIQTLPVHLYNCNLVSEHSISLLFECYEQIENELDKQLDLELFMLKKQKVFVYFHELKEFIKYLRANQLVQETQRKNLNAARKPMLGYYSSRSPKETGQSKNQRQQKIATALSLNKKVQEKLKRKGCDSQRKLTFNDGETERPEGLTKDISKGKKEKESWQKLNKMSKSRQKYQMN